MNNAQTPRPALCPQCPFARSTPKSYLDTMGDNGERFIGQAAGPFQLPCHMTKQFGKWRSDPNACQACHGAAVYRRHIGFPEGRGIPVAGECDHERVFSSPAELLAHHRDISLAEAQARLAETSVAVHTENEMRRAGAQLTRVLLGSAGFTVSAQADAVDKQACMVSAVEESEGKAQVFVSVHMRRDPQVLIQGGTAEMLPIASVAPRGAFDAMLRAMAIEGFRALQRVHGATG